MQIFPFLQQVCRDQHQGIAGHAKLPDKSLVHLSRHTPHRLLATQQLTKYPRGLGHRLLSRLWLVNVKDEVVIERDLGEFIEGPPVSGTKRPPHLALLASRGTRGLGLLLGLLTRHHQPPRRGVPCS